MESILILLAQLIGAALAGAGVLKGGEAIVNKYRGQKEIAPSDPNFCAVTHSRIDSKLESMCEDLAEIKQVLGKLVEIQIELISLRGDLRHEIDEKMSGHIDNYHRVA